MKIKNAAFLIGISQYPDHTLKGVPNDLDLLANALQERNYAKEAIHIFSDTQTTQAELHTLLAQIQAEYQDVEQGTCYLHIGASGVLSFEPLAGGVQPTDGEVLNLSKGLPFSVLNDYLPVQPGIRVMATLDC
ncbi:MAG: caspase family protein [Ardenticatenaceae bacterium]